MPLAVSQTRAPIPAALKYYALRLFLAACAASLADFLFFEEAIGLSLPLFFAYLGLMLLALQKPVKLSRRAAIVGGGFLLALLPLIEEVNFLGKCFALIGLAYFSLMLAPPHTWPNVQSALRQLILSCVGIYFFFKETASALRRTRAWFAGRSLRHIPLGWAVPAALGLTFVLLFMRANPLIEAGLEALVPAINVHFHPARRLIGWLIAFLSIWPLVRRYQTRLPPAQSMALPKMLRLTDRVSLNALIGFNLLFAVQNLSDLLYLWGGVRLPEGMTYADYAHRGAYALMLASLLAAGFSLLTARPGGPIDRVPCVRPFLVVWIGQCLFLVFSALLRLDLYIEAYALTHFRLAALVWMGLVGFGFGLILVWLRRRTAMIWLLKCNAAALCLTLYATCFVDADAVIARYNFTHCQEIAGVGPSFDVGYLQELGPGALLAVLDAQAQFQHGSPIWRALVEKQRQLQRHLADAPHSWRGWGFRTWRLRHALATRIALAQKREARDGASHSGGRR